MKTFKYSMLLGTLINSLGCWVRYFAKHNFALSIMGQTITGLAQTFTLPAPVYLADRFFSKREKFGVITLCIQADYLGNAFGYLFPCWIVRTYPERIPNLLLYQAIMLTVPFIVCCLVVKEKPNKPPNKYASVQTEPFFKSLKSLFNKSFIIPMLAFSTCFTLSQTVPSVIDYLLKPLHYKPIKMGIIGLTYSATGMIAGLFSTVLIAKYPTFYFFKKCIQVLMVLSTIAMIVFCIFSYIKNFIVMNFIMGFAGVGIIGILPFACQVLEEISFPVNENISINTFIFFSATNSLIMTEVSTLDVLKGYGSFSNNFYQIKQFLIALLALLIPSCLYFLVAFNPKYYNSN